MTQTVQRKVEGGKLFRLQVKADTTITDVQLTGDFFIQPPEAREIIETKLEGIPADSSKETILRKLDEIDAELVGMSRENIADATKEAIN